MYYAFLYFSSIFVFFFEIWNVTLPFFRFGLFFLPTNPIIIQKVALYLLVSFLAFLMRWGGVLCLVLFHFLPMPFLFISCIVLCLVSSSSRFRGAISTSIFCGFSRLYVSVVAV